MTSTMKFRNVIVPLLVLSGGTGAFMTDPSFLRSKTFAPVLVRRTTSSYMVNYSEEFKELDISDVLAETEAALLAANNAMENSPQDEQQAVASGLVSGKKPQEEEHVVASGLGGAGLGLFLGSAVAVQLPVLVIAPAILAAACGVASYSAANSGGVRGRTAQKILGKPTSNLGNFFKTTLENGMSSMANNAQRQLDEVGHSIQEVSTVNADEMQDSSKELAATIPADLKELPSAEVYKIQDTRPVEELAEHSVEMQDEVPGKIAEATSMSTQEASHDVAEEMKSAPSKPVQVLEIHVSDAVPELVDDYSVVIDALDAPASPNQPSPVIVENQQSTRVEKMHRPGHTGTVVPEVPNRSQTRRKAKSTITTLWNGNFGD